MLIRLNVPIKWHRPRDIIDTDVEANDIDEAFARRLIHRGHATDVDELITPVGGGWVDVYVAGGHGDRIEKVQGRAAAIEVLREAAGQ